MEMVTMTVMTKTMKTKAKAKAKAAAAWRQHGRQCGVGSSDSVVAEAAAAWGEVPWQRGGGGSAVAAAAAAAWWQRNVSSSSSAAGSMATLWRQWRRKQHHHGLMIFYVMGIFSFCSCTHNRLFVTVIVPYRVFGNKWTKLTSPFTPHSVFQPNPFRQ